jgi:SAM-dependent methyltransferase
MPKKVRNTEKQLEFYDKHSNFVNRTLIEYQIAPGIKCKFDRILQSIKNVQFFKALDIGCSGNSFIYFLPGIKHRVFCDIAFLPLKQYKIYGGYHPTCGSIVNLPYKSESFNLITALDVLEHIEDDISAASEISRVLAKKGTLIITVPHRMKYFTDQDRICGHFRRYEYKQISSIFKNLGLEELMVFPVYGQIMKIQFLQELDPQKVEIGLGRLRLKYSSNYLFRKIWDKFMYISSKLMMLDARIQPFMKTMDICLIFRKP